MNKIQELYSGKAKSVFTCDDDSSLILEFRNDTSAFDGKKIEQLDRKGAVNNQFNAFIMQKLEESGIKTHHKELLSANDSLVAKLDMFPLECVVRNISTGSLCRRLGIEEGIDLNPPTFELFLKNDELGDPMVNEHHALAFGWATLDEIEQMKALTFQVNGVLQKLFADADIILVDYKLEFGIDGEGNMLLGDEFTPDGCRLWDMNTREKLDKDRFRQNLGNVIEAYEVVGHRLGMTFNYES